MIGRAAGAMMPARHTADVALAARAVESLSCGCFCTPEFKVKPTVTFEHLATGLRQAGVLIGGERSSTAAIAHGFGTAKTYGCGLILIRWASQGTA